MNPWIITAVCAGIIAYTAASVWLGLLIGGIISNRDHHG